MAMGTRFPPFKCSTSTSGRAKGYRPITVRIVMVGWYLTCASHRDRLLRLSVVSYLNTVPLIWGILKGRERELFDLYFAVPSVCAEQVGRGETDIGIIPAIEMARQRLSYLPSTGIACRGPVRSILLISKVPLREVRTLAADSGSKTSVMLARVILAQRYGVSPRIVPMAPELPAMFDVAEAALVIGDAALAVDPATVPFHVLDLGEEWAAMTGLPMVFAVWAGREDILSCDLDRVFLDSCRFGLTNLDAIIEQESRRRGLTDGLVREYLTRNVVLQLGDEEHRGLRQFLQMASELDERVTPGRLVGC